MNALRKLGMAVLIALAFASCGSNKKMTNNNQPQPRQNGRTEIVIPCYEASRSDANFYRELGIGKSVNEQSARDQAVKSAKEMLTNRLGGLIKGISTDYSRNVSGQAPADKVQRLMEQEMTQVVEKMLNDSDNPCEKLFLEADGATYVSYYVIEISKEEIIKKSSEVLSKNEELEIEFNRDQFRKFAEKRMQDMKGE